MTEKELSKLERRIASVYRDASKELQKTIDDYFAKFEKRDTEMKSLIGTVQNGKEWTEADYKRWRINQIARGERFQALKNKLSQRITAANETAVAYVNDATPGIYSLNRNYAAYTIEKVSGNADFTLWDEQTVKRLVVEQPNLMPYYPPKRAVKRGIDLSYGKKQITSSVTSSILQGKSIKGIADDLQHRLTTMSRDSAIRTARTAVTAAQNGGRMDSYNAAQGMGIKLKREWMATLDGRTRHAHAMLDGQQVEMDKPFTVDGHSIMYPGDPSAPGYLVYNCRCTLVAVVDGVDTSDAKRRARDPETGESVLIENMSYAEWAGWKKANNLNGMYGSGNEKNVNSKNYAKSIANMLGVDEKNILIYDLPEDSQASIEKQVQKAVDYFPKLKDHFRKISYNSEISAIAESKSLTGEIQVSKSFLDYKKMAKSYAYDAKIGFFPKGTTADSIIVHEIGHQIDGFLTINKLFGGEITQYGTIRSSKAIQKEILAKIGLSDKRLREIRQEWRDRGYTGRELTDAVLWERKEFISSHVSGYAATNEREFFAECFSELITSEHPREAALALGEILERAKEMLK